MLVLKGVTKDYIAGDVVVHALKGLDIAFRKNEFVSVLGQSGCGKTTLLNIIGGLDQYTEGDMSVNGISTKNFKDGDWDIYRNHSIGFVFQNYNLIPHQTVLSNVELALTLSGISKEERRKRAVDILEKVGLGDQIYKKPNQMSGGQMQRVAIARALINNPEILLADEPTGALDSETSTQVMELLKEIAKDRLVIMVTHNPELAEQYSNRIVKLLDGKIIDDSNPYEPEYVEQKKGGKRLKKTPMSFKTALSLSLNNLMTKKTRTILTAFAGSIGIIGIALILSLSSGFQNYISRVEEDTLSSYPLTIESETVDMTGVMTSMMGVSSGEGTEHELDKVYSNTIMSELINVMVEEVQTNDLGEFKKYLEDEENGIEELTSDVQYGYDVNLNVYRPDTENGIVQVNPGTVFEKMMGSPELSAMMDTASATGSGMEVWEQMLDNQELLDSQYDIVEGRWPSAHDELVLIVDENNEISDYALYTLGIKDQSELSDQWMAIASGEELPVEEMSMSYDEILDWTFKLVLSSEHYEYDEASGAWLDKRDDEEFMKAAIENGTELKIVGIIRPSEEATATSITGAIGYTSALTEYVIDITNEQEIVQQQLADPETDVFTALPFGSAGETTEAEPFDITTLPPEQQEYIATLSEEELAALMEQYSQPPASEATYDENLKMLGVTDLDSPSMINIYPVDFAAKEQLVDIINEYNEKMTNEGKEENIINYTDYVGLIMSSVSTIIDTISYVLIAFVAISLVVSSIMIGIITYISVLERTKEIGILRSIGASKKDISRVFNAETLIVGFAAGAMGIIITLLLCIPANMIINSMTGIARVAVLPAGGYLLVLVSMLLTFIAGLIPAKMAANKDPVVALRTE